MWLHIPASHHDGMLSKRGFLIEISFVLLLLSHTSTDTPTHCLNLGNVLHSDSHTPLQLIERTLMCMAKSDYMGQFTCGISLWDHGHVRMAYLNIQPYSLFVLSEYICKTNMKALPGIKRKFHDFFPSLSLMFTRAESAFINTTRYKWSSLVLFAHTSSPSS